MSNRMREDGYALSMLIGFWLAAAFNLAGAASGVELISLVTKPFLMLFLFCWAWQVLGRPTPRAGRWLLIGIMFAWLGDVLLMLAGPGGSGVMFFALGIAGFLVMQVCYVAAFWSVPGDHLLRRSWWLLVPFAGYWAVMNWVMEPGAMRLPVLVYSLALVGMAAMALDLTARFPRSQGWPLFVGAVLFVISDSLIAGSAFGGIDLGRWQGFAVMGTYVVAQFLIVTRLVRGLNRLAGDRGGSEAVEVPTQPGPIEESAPAHQGAPASSTATEHTPSGEVPSQPATPGSERRELQDS